MSMNTNTMSMNSSNRTLSDKAEALYRNTEILAPMVRASTTPLRTLALHYGCDTVYSEEIIDKSILNCVRVVNDELHTIDYLRKSKTSTNNNSKKRKKKNSHDKPAVILRIVPDLEQDKFVFQVGTGDAVTALQAAQFVEKDMCGIDINMGCPKKFSVVGGMGSRLLTDVDRACDIVKTLRRNLSNTPVSCKIRLLKDTSSTIDFIKALEQAGANAVCIHAREVGDESTSSAKWDRLEPVISHMKSYSNIPLIVNGDMYTRKDMKELKAMSGADSVMLARPALYNTSLFRKDESNSNILLPKETVVQHYLRECVRWQVHPVNAKYVVCEFLSNRRAPIPRQLSLPQIYSNKNASINNVCACKTLPDLCKLWDVKMSISDINNTASKIITTKEERNYDDRYFTNPEELRAEQLKREKIQPSGLADDHNTSLLAECEDSDYTRNTRQKIIRN